MRDPIAQRANRVRMRVRNQRIEAQERVDRGGECEWRDCGWKHNLEWSHKHSEKKAFGISASVTSTSAKTVQQLRSELAKCHLFCPNHHSLYDSGHEALL